MKYSFKASGHPNILATHKTTLEITTDSGLTPKGDCIVAVNADFSLQRIKELMSSCGSNGKIKLTLKCGNSEEEITAVANKEFSSSTEIVLRKGDFVSGRTLGIRADKAAADISRQLAEKLKSLATTVAVTIETL